MFSKPWASVLAFLALITAAAGGAYVATRHNAADSLAPTVAAANPAAPAASTPAASGVTPQPASSAAPAAQPVAETEAAVSAERKAEAPAPATTAKAEAPPAPVAAAKRATPAPSKPANRPARSASQPARAVPMTGAPAPGPQADPQAPPPQAAAVPLDAPKPIEPPKPEPPRAPQFEEVIVPAAAILGLQVETSTSTERARVEDRIDARVSRDVMAGGRVAIPAGSRVIGSVTTVEHGGKLKDTARLGIRFHTLVLADGTQVQIHTDPVYRLGEPPAAASSKKIGGAAIGGAVLGAILGGGKGAAVGGAVGAAGGTAAVMSGDRNAATLRQGEYLNVKLASPATMTIERREQ